MLLNVLYSLCSIALCFNLLLVFLLFKISINSHLVRSKSISALNTFWLSTAAGEAKWKNNTAEQRCTNHCPETVFIPNASTHVLDGHVLLTLIKVLWEILNLKSVNSLLTLGIKNMYRWQQQARKVNVSCEDDPEKQFATGQEHDSYENVRVSQKQRGRGSPGSKSASLLECSTDKMGKLQICSSATHFSIPN